MLFILLDIKEMPKAMHTSRYIKEDVTYTHKHDQCIFQLEKKMLSLLLKMEIKLY